MRGPSITVTCDCGTRNYLAYGERWTCPDCSRTWDTGQIPAEEYEVLRRAVRRYRLIVIGPPVAIAAVLIPAAVFVDVSYAFLAFIFVLAYGLLVLPRLRRQQTHRVLAVARRWKLHPE